MQYRMQLVRRSADGALHLLGEPLSIGAIIDVLDDTDIGGIVSVEPIDQCEGYEYLVTLSLDSLDAKGDVHYVTDFDPHREFPHVPAASHTIYEPASSPS